MVGFGACNTKTAVDGVRCADPTTWVWATFVLKPDTGGVGGGVEATMVADAVG